MMPAAGNSQAPHGEVLGRSPSLEPRTAVSASFEARAVARAPQDEDGSAIASPHGEADAASLSRGWRYGAFVLDPEGHNIEAVCHDPE
jgi:hypothetical protein